MNTPLSKPVGIAVLGALTFLVSPALHAQEVGRVISSVPVIQQVAVPRPVCNSNPVLVQQPSSGAGALMGAIAGGAAGNAIGGGSGRAVATLLGVIGGAALGDRVEGPNTQLQQATNCVTQTFYENRAVGYNVTYEYAGRQHTVQLPYDPGPTLSLQLVPVGAAPTAPPAPAAAAPEASPLPPVTLPSASPPVTVIREVVTVPVYPPAYAPAYPSAVYPSAVYPSVYPPPYGYYPAPAYRPFVPNVSLHLGYVRGSRRHWH
ncbi:glycine zipper 2TM domain-containing protein [Ramlibacter rhizophilus]|uniref:Glycine zipper 2TM domain-containing protein n=1 Tax=Ramlibacter rhizophilus TaxID=1781167 RepID=A0A4Z0BPP7_9BURK|nr:glycine zipper 2TM domain-containing protein [Ramlibacter rhizophilus]TFY99958.1 glycine zipper 2TM domain-containing protein [Ramlibacter rhizophilus]